VIEKFCGFGESVVVFCSVVGFTKFAKKPMAETLRARSCGIIVTYKIVFYSVDKNNSQ
jgi:hypothetical protein